VPIQLDNHSQRAKRHQLQAWNLQVWSVGDCVLLCTLWRTVQIEPGTGSSARVCEEPLAAVWVTPTGPEYTGEGLNICGGSSRVLGWLSRTGSAGLAMGWPGENGDGCCWALAVRSTVTLAAGSVVPFPIVSSMWHVYSSEEICHAP
jgi:hypothetical protein